jgi:ssDNA-binding Zn-finger/Zn-ribbon topoisomerase 1
MPDNETPTLNGQGFLMAELRKRIKVPCPNCGKVLEFSEGNLRRYGDFQIGCPYCKVIVSARNALSKRRRTKSDPDASVEQKT